MRDPIERVKPEVRALEAYTLAARPARVKIDQNQNPFELPEALKRGGPGGGAPRALGRYPDFDPTTLRVPSPVRGWTHGRRPGRNGSNELIEALLLVTVGAGTRVVVPEAAFTLYALLTAVLGGEVVGCGRRRPSYDAAALVAAAREREAALTIVCSPNNPTGSVMEAGDVERLCLETPAWW